MSRTLINALKQIREGSIAEQLLTQELRDKIAGLVSTQQSILNTMSTDAERVSALDALTAAFQAADSSLEGMLTGLVAQATTAVQTETNRALGVEADLRNLIDGLGSGVTQMDGRLNQLKTDLEAKDADLDAAISQAVEDLGSLTTRFGELEADLSGIKAKQAQLEEKQTSLEQEQGQLSGKVSSLTGKHDALRGEHDELAASFNQHKQAADQERSQLSGKVSGLEEQVGGKVSLTKIRAGRSLSGLIDGTNKIFTLPEAIVTGTLAVFWNGQMLLSGDDYSLEGQELTFIGSPDPGDKVFASYVAA